MSPGTALCLAAQDGQLEIAELLLRHMCEVDKAPLFTCWCFEASGNIDPFPKKHTQSLKSRNAMHVRKEQMKAAAIAQALSAPPRGMTHVSQEKGGSCATATNGSSSRAGRIQGASLPIVVFKTSTSASPWQPNPSHHN